MATLTKDKRLIEQEVHACIVYVTNMYMYTQGTMRLQDFMNFKNLKNFKNLDTLRTFNL